VPQRRTARLCTSVGYRHPNRRWSVAGHMRYGIIGVWLAFLTIQHGANRINLACIYTDLVCRHRYRRVGRTRGWRLLCIGQLPASRPSLNRTDAANITMLLIPAPTSPRSEPGWATHSVPSR
jgi:hypothetical protein